MASLTTAELIAERLKSQGVERVFGLCGGHVQPLWDAISRAGIPIVDVRHEAAAVYMAHATAELTGELAVAVVTAGPGLTNAITAIANAWVSGSPVLVICGRPPRPQSGMGAMQDIAQSDIVAPICRAVERVSEIHHVLPRLDKVIGAALGEGPGSPGPAYIDFPTDLLVEQVPLAAARRGAATRREVNEWAPNSHVVARAAQLISESRRVVVLGGRAVRSARDELLAFLVGTGALYLDSGESRGVVREDSPGFVPAQRRRAMSEADLVITLGRRLDFQLAYGSDVAFSLSARFLRIGANFEETGENRRGEVEVFSSTRLALEALLSLGARPADPDEAWLSEIREANADRIDRHTRAMALPNLGSDGRMSPDFLIHAIDDRLDSESVVVADGGDVLSFARAGLRVVDYLDCGAFGCLGVGVPFATAAALARPEAQVIAIIGDGSFGFTAMEINTAVRHHAAAVFIVANNEGWNIERHDQIDRFAGNTVGVDLPHCRYDMLARSLGAYAERVEDPDELADALDRALANRPSVLEVMVTRDVKSPDYLSGLASVPARQALSRWNDAEQALYRLDGEHE